MENVKRENEAIFSGKIVGKRKTEKTLFITLLTNPGKYANFPRIIFFGDKAKEYDSQFEIGDNVSIKGHLQSSKRVIDNEVSFTQSIVGDSIVRAKTALEIGGETDNVKGYQIASENVIRLTGTVRNIYSPRKNFISAKISTPNGKGYSTISMIYFGNNCGDILNDIHFGDKVSIVGKIETSKKTAEDKTIYYENVVIEDIGKIKE